MQEPCGGKSCGGLAAIYSFLEFLHRTLCSLNYFNFVHQIYRWRWLAFAGRMLDSRCSWDRLASRDQFIPTRWRRLRNLLLIRPAAQNKLDVALRAGKLQLLGVVESKEQRYHINLLRLALWIGFYRLPGC